MKKMIKKPFALITDIGRKAHLTLLQMHGSLLARAEKWNQNPRERAIYKTSAAFTLVGLTLSNSAHADGFADMFNISAEQGDQIKESAGKLFAAAGFGGAGVGGYNWWRKGKEGEQSQIKGGQIIWPLVGGAALGATGFMLIKAGETVGIASSEQGALPQ
ncbi:DUF6750 family protein [Pseudomonas asuensis]|uniref:Uncharacterized protein n=1 Tax=Pseudomonas asuensis TaxID=1825787 RepID=A0ABQ2H364_9PSED|nr:DUF6750 family protein [Pseudomonas asuensis]GGM26096.1 hypothetical protein GCM10009425_41040 [Pseudomonas asuensis]